MRHVRDLAGTHEQLTFANLTAPSRMRFHCGAIPHSPDFNPGPVWNPLREPSPWLTQFLAIPIGFASGALVTALWIFVTPLMIVLPTVTLSWFLLAFAVAFTGIIVVHELIHAAIHPRARRTQDSILGFWPSRVLFYAHYNGALSRNRFIAILLMPLLVISLLPLLIAILTQTSSAWVAFVSSFNAFLSCGDILGAGIVLFQIPPNTTVRNQGWRTYWIKSEMQET